MARPDVRVELLEGARFGVAVTRSVFGVPARARVVLALDRDVDLASGRVVLRHEESLLWRSVRAVVAALGLVPAGVSFEAGAVVVSLAALAERGGWADLLPMLRRRRGPRTRRRAARDRGGPRSAATGRAGDAATRDRADRRHSTRRA